MPKQQQLVYLSDEQFQTLVAQGSITVDGQTVEYSEDDIYVTPQKDAYIKPVTGIPASDLADGAVPVQDIQVNGASILQNGIANVPIASDADAGHGVVRGSTAYGTHILNNGAISINKASDTQLKNGSNDYCPVVSSNQHSSTFYGLAKAAGDTTQSQSSNAVGTYTPEAQSAIQTMLDVPSNADLTQAITDVTQKIQHMYICSASEYNSETGVPTVANPDSKTFYLVPSSEGSPNLYIEWVYLNNAWERFGSTTIDLSNYVQKTDYASTSDYGLVKIGAGLQISVDATHRLMTQPASSTEIKNGSVSYKLIDPGRQHESTFYGLAKAAGDTTQSQSSNAIGTYTDSAKSAIRSMLGAANADDIVAVQDTQPTSEDNKIWLPETPPASVEVPTVAEMNAALAGKVGDVQVNGVSVVQNGVANVPIASQGHYGAVRTYDLYGTQIKDGSIGIVPAVDRNFKEKSGTYKAVVGENVHRAIFWGLANAAGDTTQSVSANTIGTYTPEAKGAIQSMLGTNTMIAPDENDLVADQDYAVGDLFTANGKVYKATSEILTGAAIVTTGNNANCEETSVVETFAKTVDLNSKANKANTEITGSLSMYRKANTDKSAGSTALGVNNTATGLYSTALGNTTTASGTSSFTTGTNTLAAGSNASAFGNQSKANGANSLASGELATADGKSTSARGRANALNTQTIFPEWAADTEYKKYDRVKVTTESNGETTVALYSCRLDHTSSSTFDSSKWEDVTNYMDFADVVGNGINSGERSNAYALDWNGNAYFRGNVYVGCDGNSAGGNMLTGGADISQAPTEATAQDLLASLTTDTSLNDIFLTVLGWYIDNLPQNESAQDIANALKLEADRLEQIYDFWIAEKEGA